MCCVSLRRILAVFTLGALAVLLAVPPSAGQVDDGPVGKAGKAAKGGKAGGGIGGFPGGGAGNFGGVGKKGRVNFGAGPNVVLPEGLKYVPADAIAFLHIRIADSLNGAPSQALLKQLRADGEQGKLVGQIETRLGVRLADLESITVFVLDLPAITRAPLAAAAKSTDGDETPACLVALSYSKPVDRKAVLRALADKSEAPLWPTVSGMFLSDRCVLFGTATELLAYTARASISGPIFADEDGGFSPGSRTRGSLRTQLAAGAEPHLIVAGTQVPTIARTRLRTVLRGGKIGAYGALLPLVNSSVGLTLDMRDAADITLRFSVGDHLTLEALQSLRTLAEMALDGNAPPEGPIALSRDLHTALRKAVAQTTIDQVSPSVVEVRLRLETSPDEVARFLAQTVVGLR